MIKVQRAIGKAGYRKAIMDIERNPQQSLILKTKRTQVDLNLLLLKIEGSDFILDPENREQIVTKLKKFRDNPNKSHWVLLINEK